MMFPITFLCELKAKPGRRRNGTNWPGVVILNPAAPYPAAVWAQEAFESLWMMNPLNAIRRMFSRETRRQMEYMGHEIEVQAAAILYNVKLADKRKAEATSMQSGYGGLFSKLSVVQIIDRMQGCSTGASNWVARHKKAIAKYK